MLTYEEALHRIVNSVQKLPIVKKTLLESLGSTLAEDIIATVSLPPFTNSAMDGFAVVASDTNDASEHTPVRLPLLPPVKAGDNVTTHLPQGMAIPITTGSMLPPGADAVVPVEYTTTDEDQVLIIQPVDRGRHIRIKGEDILAGNIVLNKGTQITPATIALLASQGIVQVPVYRHPTVAVISTGDELVDPGDLLSPGKIYNSNGSAITAQAIAAGAEVITHIHAGDSREALENAFDQCKDIDLIITSGGVSVGAFDFVKDIVSQNGSLDFWKAAIRPGKPITYGTYRDSVYFGLPGNPVSTMITFELFVRPVIKKMMGSTDLTRPLVEATLETDFEHPTGRRSFIRVKVAYDKGEYKVQNAGDQGSAMLHSMAKANGLLIIHEDIERLHAGDTALVMLLE